jgi:hypothetical protein
MVHQLTSVVTVRLYSGAIKEFELRMEIELLSIITVAKEEKYFFLLTIPNMNL